MSTFDWTSLSDQLAVNDLIRTLNIRMPRAVRALRSGPLQTVVDPRDFGTIGNGNDDTAVWQAAINAIPASGGVLIVPPLHYHISHSLVFRNRQQLWMLGLADQGATNYTADFLWTGSDGGVAFLVDRCRDSTFERFSIRSDQVHTIGVGIDLDQQPATGPTVSTNNTFRKVTIDGVTDKCTIGVRVSQQATDNNDLHVFDDCHIVNGSLSGGSGYRFLNGESKFHRFFGGAVVSFATGIDQTGGGSFQCWGLNFSGNTTDVYVGVPTDALGFYGCQSESANKFLDTGTAGAAQAVLIAACRLDTNNVGGDNTYLRYRFAGPLVLIANDFASGVNRPSVIFQASGGSNQQRVASIGCQYPNNAHIFNDLAAGQAHFLANSYADGTGAGQAVYRASSLPVSVDRGNGSVTIQVGQDEPIQQFRTALTADRTCTVNITGATQGDTFRISRSAAGAFNLTVQDSTPTTLKVLTAGQWVDVGFDGTAWRELAFGGL